MKRLSEKGLVEPSGRKNGYYEVVENHFEEMDWMDIEATSNPYSNIILPFSINNIIYIYINNIIIIAGSSNIGKTALIYDFILSNFPTGLV